MPLVYCAGGVLCRDFVLRTSRALLMNWLWYGAVLPAEQWLGRLCGRLTLSVGEVLILTAVFCAILWLPNVPRRIIAARGRRWGMALHLTLTALCAVLTVYAGFCLTWGIGYTSTAFRKKRHPCPAFHGGDAGGGNGLFCRQSGRLRR